MKNLSYFLRAAICLALIFAPPAAAEDVLTYKTHWQNVLDTYLHDGFLDYARLQENPAALKAGIDDLERVSGREYDAWIESRKMVFWINAYNMAAVDLVLQHYPLRKSRFSLRGFRYPEDSIQQIPKAWDRKVIRLLDKYRSLDEIESILRNEFSDPRIHFALVCASIGCPRLCEEPYEAPRLEAQLSDQVRGFLRNAKKAYYDEEGERLYLSPILNWYEQDFKPLGGLLVFLKPYFPPAISAQITPRTRIQWLNYDWTLNDVVYADES